MPNRNLTAEELAKAQVLLNCVRAQLQSLSGGDPGLLFAYRRKIYKELTSDEQDKPVLVRAERMSELYPDVYSPLECVSFAPKAPDRSRRLAVDATIAACTPSTARRAR